MKTITINKTVVKKNGEDLKSEETFYAGIFKDEDCTQLADGVSQNIVPLVMDGESTATAKTEVTVPVGGEEIKLYVTEVTADGTPVALNDTFEYDVEINDGFVTLSGDIRRCNSPYYQHIQKGRTGTDSRAGTGTYRSSCRAHPGSSDHTAARGQGSYNKWRQDR